MNKYMLQIKSVLFASILFFAQLAYSQCPAGLGTGVRVVNSLPYTAIDSTCGMVNNLIMSGTGANIITCGSLGQYTAGEDVVYIVTPQFSGVMSVNITSSSSNMGIFVYNGCPLLGQGGVCVNSTASASGNQSISFNAVANTTYYIIVDSWPNPNCHSQYTINISSPPAPKDITVSSLSSPIQKICYSSTDTVSVTIQNTGTTTLNFAVDTLRLSYNITGPNPTTGNVVVSSGTLAPNATQVVTILAGYNMSVNATYNFTINNISSWDQIAGNNNLGPVSRSPLGFLNLSANPLTINTGSSSNLTATSVAFERLLITEVVQDRNAQGATSPYPAYVNASPLAADMVEITNASSAPINLSGVTLEYYAGTGLQHTFTFPANYILQGNAVAVIGEGVGNNDLANNYFRSNRNNTNPYLSNTPVGYVLKRGSNIIDVVATNSFVFPSGSGVTAAQWSGSVASSNTRAGIRRSGADNNTAANWSVSSSANVMNIGTINQGLTLLTAPTINWTGPGSFNATGFNVNTGNIPTAGTYKYYASYSSSGCSFTDSISITVIQAVTPVANFVTSDTITFIGNLVNITDLSTNIPTNWTWTITPATFNYQSGTNANSQNPVVSFTQSGFYTITLTASNGAGSSSITKTNRVFVLNNYCVSSANIGGNTDIGNVRIAIGSTNVLNNGNATPTLNNSNAINTYTNFTGSVSAVTLFKGTTYSFNVSQISIGTFNQSWVNVFIDYNGNGTFDPNERVLTGGPTTQTVPTISGNVSIPPTAINGYVLMRVIMQEGGNANSPSCGTYSIGETEDYLVKLEPAGPIDLTANGLFAPVGTNCFTTTETVSITVTNAGSNTIRFANTPAILNWSVAGPNPQNGTLTINSDSLVSGQSRNYAVTAAYNMIAPGSYIFRANINIGNDANILNDTLIPVTIVNNVIATFPHLVDFTPFTVAANATGYINGWEAVPGNTTTTFRWNVHAGTTPTANTGPNTDFSGLPTGKFIYTEADQGTNGAIATVISPCINFNGVANPGMDFYYHMFGATMGTLAVDVFVNNNWTQVWSRTGQDQIAGTSPWKRVFIPLYQYSNQVIKIRFRGVRGTGTTGDMAVDNVRFYDVPPTDLASVRLVQPVTTNCFTNNQTVSFMIYNDGSSAINFANTNATLNWSVAGPNPSGPNPFNINTGIINPQDSMLITVTTTYNMSAGGTYIFSGNINITGDANAANNTFTNATIVNNVISVLPHTQNFDGFFPSANATGYGAGWSADPTNTFTQYRWNIQTLNSSGNQTGPPSGNGGSGNYIFTQSDNGVLNSIAYAISPCIQLGNISSPALEFAYHMFGAAINKLSVDVLNSNGQWVAVDSIIGQQQTSKPAPWLKKTIPLFSFANSTVRIRFRGHRGGGNLGHMAVDDFFLFNRNKDIGVVSLVKPIAGNACRSNADSIIVRIKNDAFEQLDLSIDPVTITTTVTGANPNVFNTVVNSGILNPGQTLDVLISPNYNMAFPQSTFTFNIVAALAGDTYNQNDALNNVIAINPAPSINATTNKNLLCPDSIAQLNLTFTGNYTHRVNIFSENFNIPPTNWTITDNGTPLNQSQFQFINSFSGLSLNASPFAHANAGVSSTAQVNTTLQTPIYNVPAYDTVWIAWQQFYDHPTITPANTSAIVEVFNGTAWVQVASFTSDLGNWNNPNNQFINVTPHINPNFRVRFVYNSTSNQANVRRWAIDNFRVVAAAPKSVFLWSPSTGLSSTTAINPTAAPPTTTTYFVNVTDTTVGCSTIDSILINSFPIFPINLDNQGNPNDNTINVCEGTNILLNANPNNQFNFSTYTWSTGGIGQLLSITPSGGSTQVVWIRAKQANGCFSTDTVTISSKPAPVINLGSDVTICVTDTLVLDAGFGFSSYLWNTGSTNQTLTIPFNSASNIYSVTVSMDYPAEAITCSSYDEIRVTVSPCTSIDEISNSITHTVYPNPNDGKFNLTISGGDANKALIEIFDLTGKIVTQLNVDNTIQQQLYLQLPNVDSGIYLMKITSSTIQKVDRIIVR